MFAAIPVAILVQLLITAVKEILPQLGHDFLLFLGDLLLKQVTQYFPVNKHIMTAQNVNYISLNVYLCTGGPLNSGWQKPSFNYYRE
jgi:hypothetical protein